VAALSELEPGTLPPRAEELRAQVREFLGSWAFTPRCDSWLTGADPAFSRALGERGWLGMTLPERYGGHGRSPLERFVVIEELLAAGAPVGAHWIADRQTGPSILAHGTEEQKQRFLPAIARGEGFFAIGMSEPDSGSDLASVRTRAEVDGEGGWRLNGTKVWTSGAHIAHAILLLARSAPLENDRHAGLSQFIVPLPSEGVTIRPILGLSGEHHFNEVVFDDVFVPWENVFLYRDIKRCNEAYSRTGAVVHMTHQVVVKNVAKCEFMMGLASLMVSTIGAETFQHIHEKLAELWVNMETMKALLRAAEADAQLDEWGVMRPAWNPLDAARNLFPRVYPRMVEIIQQIGASGLVAMPMEADLKGPLVEDIKRYYQAARAEAFDRIPLFRLAWDASLSAFASRQVLYERFFFGDPVRMAGALVANHGAQIREQADAVQAFVREGRDEAFGTAR